MTFETGEDFHVSHTMLKYANIRTHVMPYNPDDDETRGSKFRGLSFVNAATTSRCESAMALRYTLYPADLDVKTDILPTCHSGASLTWTCPSRLRIGCCLSRMEHTHSDVPLRDSLWMGALKAGSRMRWMDMFTAEEAHVDPATLLVFRTEADVTAMLPMVHTSSMLGVSTCGCLFWCWWW